MYEIAFGIAKNIGYLNNDVNKKKIKRYSDQN